jgi:predicted RNA-binding protein with RPS1 domain
MPRHVIVDGSNLATEGRAMPSLQQLNDAVMAFIAEYPDSLITVVVDATFGHRINASEVAEFDAAVANNEVVAPPAGAIGRGDAFLLSIANKVGATVLSNDSFQEFHGTYTWLFDEGRLIGGKPVPHIGWVFVARAPVRGPISRSAVKDARRKKEGGVPLPASDRGGRGRREKRPQVSAEASLPMPVPKAPPPNATIGRTTPPAKPQTAPAKPAATPVKPAATATSAVNDFNSFLSFVEHHPIGTSVNATVETYSSHGAYVKLDGGVVGYVPLRLMSDPPPRSAREFLRVGDAVTLVVESFAPARRSIDLAMTSMATAKPPAPAKRTRKAAAAAAERTPPEAAASTEEPAAKKVGGRRKKAAASVEAPLVEAPVEAAAAAEAAAAPSRPTKRPAKSEKAEKAAPASAAKKAAKTTKATKKSSSSPDAASEPAAPTAPPKKSRAKKAASGAPASAPDSVPAPAAAPAAKSGRSRKAAPAPPVAAVDPAAENAATIDAAPASAAARRRRAPRASS